MLQQQGALARKLVPAWRQLGPAAAAGLHRSSAALQEVALQTAPERMGEAAEAVKEVMGEGSEVAAPPEPLPPAQLNFSDPQAAFKAKSTLDIMRSLLVFSCCKIRPLVAHADSVLAWSKKVFGSTLTNAVIRHTFYKQFVAGESVAACCAALRVLRQHSIGGVTYCGEKDDVAEEEGPQSRQGPQASVIVRTYTYESERVCDARMSVFLKSIEAAHSAEGQGFAAIKVTALGPPALLETASNSLVQIRNLFSRFDADGNGTITKDEFEHVYREVFVDEPDWAFSHLDVSKRGLVDYVSWISRVSVMDTAAIASRCRSRGPFAEAALNEQEMQLMRNMMGRVDRLARAAADADVRLLIDAEHSYFQPAIDNTVTELQRQYNRDAPRIYNTVQCYLKDSHSRLLDELERARRENYKYGVKLVRGAYMVLERQRAQEMGYPDPIHATKDDTHANYNACVEELLRCVKAEGAEVMVASHNQQSIELAVDKMAALGMPPSSGVYFGQLLGMADHLTYTLGAHGYGAYKYVPFGEVDEVMPYLIRRAQENSDMLGGMGGEMGMLRTELVRRLGLTLQPPPPGGA